MKCCCCCFSSPRYLQSRQENGGGGGGRLEWQSNAAGGDGGQSNCVPQCACIAAANPLAGSSSSSSSFVVPQTTREREPNINNKTLSTVSKASGLCSSSSNMATAGSNNSGNNSKVYLSGLSADVDEDAVRECLAAAGIPAEERIVGIVVKRTTTAATANDGSSPAASCYAFVEFGSPSAATEAIEKLNGFSFRGSTINAEFSESKRSTSQGTTKVVLSDIPTSMDMASLEAEFAKFGTVQSTNEEHSSAKRSSAKTKEGEDGDVENGEEESSSSSTTKTLTVSYASREQAEEAVRGLNDTEISGVRLQARLLERRSPKRTLGGPPGGGQRAIDFPLRILVQSEMVGAIIGRGGQTIRQITQQTRARVDVHRKENLGNTEKAITIYGQPENCTNACNQILKVMKEEAKNTGKPEEISLKMLAHNNLIGRIIGKQGATIKKIMEETGTKITVSSINDINSFNLERIITISGEVDQISKAEAEVSTKLRAAYENDVQAMAPQTMMFPGLHPTAMLSTAGMAVPAFNHSQGLNGRMAPPAGGAGGGAGAGGAGGAGGYFGGQMPPRGYDLSALQGAPQMQETVFLYVPNNSVGAIIGTKGGNVRNIIKCSGASVKIAQADETPSHDASVASGVDKVSPSSSDRKVTILGNPESQWKAQFLIFEKLREEGFARSAAASGGAGGVIEEIRLTAEIMVPSSQVGRIIGKLGSNVRELQKNTGAVIKLPEQGTAAAAAAGGGNTETPVHITGSFYSVQSAQRRLRSMILAAVSSSVNAGGQNHYQSHPHHQGGVASIPVSSLVSPPINGGTIDASEC